MALNDRLHDDLLDKLFSPTIWSDKIVEEYKKGLTQSITGAPRPSDVLAIAIILDNIVQIMKLRPDWRFSEIIGHIPKSAKDDGEMAEALNQLVCSLQSDDKTDSLSC